MALVPSPFEVDDVEIIGLMLVAEAETGLIRLASPLTHPDEIRDQLIRACREPVAGTRPGRPAILHCTDPVLMDRLRDVSRMLDIEVVKVDSLPTVREAEEALRGASAVPAPGMTQDLDAWHTVLTQLARLAPWRVIAEDALFTFHGGLLDAAVAQVIGRGGEALGIVLYESEADHERFLRASMSLDDPTAFREVCCLSLQLERPEELTDNDVASCVQLGLALPGGRYPRLIGLVDGEPGPCSPEEQSALLAAVEAVTALCARDLASIANGEVCELEMTSSTGWRLAVTVTPSTNTTADVFPSLVAGDHTVVCGSIEVDAEPPTRHPCVVLKLRKADALKLARQCGPIVAIELYGDRQSGLALVACDRDGPVGQLVSYPPGPEATAIGHHLASQTSVYLAISAGGPKRSGIQPEHFVYGETLPTRGRDRWE